MRVTIDTNFLIQACLNNSWGHIYLLETIRRDEHKICLDSNSHMIEEYRKKLSGKEFFEKWYQENCTYFQWYSGKLSKKHVSILSELGCHEPPDHIVIAVAFNSGKILFTEDSDMGKGEKGQMPPHNKALEYLQTELKLQVCDCDEAIDLVNTGG